MARPIDSITYPNSNALAFRPSEPEMSLIFNFWNEMIVPSQMFHHFGSTFQPPDLAAFKVVFDPNVGGTPTGIEIINVWLPKASAES
jgi:hypothetical protein